MDVICSGCFQTPASSSSSQDQVKAIFSPSWIWDFFAVFCDFFRLPVAAQKWTMILSSNLHDFLVPWNMIHASWETCSFVLAFFCKEACKFRSLLENLGCNRRCCCPTLGHCCGLCQDVWLQVWSGQCLSSFLCKSTTISCLRVQYWSDSNHKKIFASLHVFGGRRQGYLCLLFWADLHILTCSTCHAWHSVKLTWDKIEPGEGRV